MKTFARHLAFAVCLISLATTVPSSPAQAPVPNSPAIQARAQAILDKMTLDEKIAYVGGTGFAARAVPRLNIPALEMSDGPYGTRSNVGLPRRSMPPESVSPQAGTPHLPHRSAAVSGETPALAAFTSCSARCKHLPLSAQRSKLRIFGEDPFLTSAIANGYITGMQQQGVSATIKHFLANNSEFLRHDSDSIVDERALRELYLPAFESAVKVAHVGAIMDSYNLINGQHATQNSYFNTQIARKEWGFDSVMMSDWDATYDGVAAANGGLDIEMPTGKFMSPATLSAAVKAGTVTEATINEKVLHILTTAIRFGWLDRDQRESSISFLDPANNAIALESAREGAVLLKNEGNILPLSKSAVKTILVVGPDAYPGTPVGGGSAGVVPFHLVSAFEGISTAMGSGATVLYDKGLPSLGSLAASTSYSTAASSGQPGVTLESFTNNELQGEPASRAVVPHITLEGLSIKTIIENLEAAMAMIFATQTSRSRTASPATIPLLRMVNILLPLKILVKATATVSTLTTNSSSITGRSFAHTSLSWS